MALGLVWNCLNQLYLYKQICLNHLRNLLIFQLTACSVFYWLEFNSGVFLNQWIKTSWSWLTAGPATVALSCFIPQTCCLPSRLPSCWCQWGRHPLEAAHVGIMLWKWNQRMEGSGVDLIRSWRLDKWEKCLPLYIVNSRLIFLLAHFVFSPSTLPFVFSIFFLCLNE